jgi:hypothetical protein
MEHLSGAYMRSAVTSEVENVTVKLRATSLNCEALPQGYYSFSTITSGSYTISAVTHNSSYSPIIKSPIICEDTGDILSYEAGNRIYGPSDNSGDGPGSREHIHWKLHLTRKRI